MGELVSELLPGGRVDLDALSPQPFSARRAALARSLTVGGVEAALLVEQPSNVRYLTGFTGSAGVVLVDRDGVAQLLTDERYRERAAAECAELEVVVATRAGQRDHVLGRAKAAGGLALEAEHVTWARQQDWSSELADDVPVLPTTRLVEELRLVKDEAETQRIATAAAVADACLADALPLLTIGATELEIRRHIEGRMVALGADGPGYDTIVASGPFSSRPHHAAGDRVVEQGDLVVIDVGAAVDGYTSDMTRTFVIGAPDDEQSAMFELARAAQAAGVAAVREGVTGDQVDGAAREVIAAAGRGDEFVHGVGHGLGLQIHEVPFLLGSHVPLRAGQVVTVEPGVYRPGFGGVRVEDTVVVTVDGCRTLTHHPKDFILD